jgi:hypothetical protein
MAVYAFAFTTIAFITIANWPTGRRGRRIPRRRSAHQRQKDIGKVRL